MPAFLLSLLPPYQHHCNYGIFVTFRNNLNRFWDFYNGTNMGAGSLKAITPKKTAIELSTVLS